jgi:hypothetical protein
MVLVQVNQDRGIVDEQGLPEFIGFFLSFTMHTDDSCDRDGEDKQWRIQEKVSLYSSCCGDKS